MLESASDVNSYRYGNFALPVNAKRRISPPFHRAEALDASSVPVRLGYLCKIFVNIGQAFRAGGRGDFRIQRET
jgi:hypothetical protein